MAPGIQFSKATVVEGDEAKEVNPAIELITPALVKSEQQETLLVTIQFLSHSFAAQCQMSLLTILLVFNQ
jgi:hypothetical protein